MVPEDIEFSWIITLLYFPNSGGVTLSRRSNLSSTFGIWILTMPVLEDVEVAFSISFLAAKEGEHLSFFALDSFIEISWSGAIIIGIRSNYLGMSSFSEFLESV